jgi:hypothetical protein
MKYHPTFIISKTDVTKFYCFSLKTDLQSHCFQTYNFELILVTQLKEIRLNKNNQQQQIDMESIYNWVLEHFYLQTSKMMKSNHNE